MSFERRSGAGWATHPGEILSKEFLTPMGLSGYALAKALGVTPQRVNDITKEKTGISAEMAFMIAKFFGTTPEFWMNLQSAFELASTEKALKKKLDKIEPYDKAAA